jgi:multisubunit Na+/H+ antiporter MnhG subunit
VRHGISFFSGKVLIIIVIIIILNPLVAHIIARAAMASGHPIENPDGKVHTYNSHEASNSDQK